MNFLDGSLYPENQQPLIITAAPYGHGFAEAIDAILAQCAQ